MNESMLTPQLNMLGNMQSMQMLQENNPMPHMLQTPMEMYETSVAGPKKRGRKKKVRDENGYLANTLVSG